MNCQYCNTPVPNGAPFCPGCGAPTGQVPQQQGQYAPPPQGQYPPPQGQYAPPPQGQFAPPPPQGQFAPPPPQGQFAPPPQCRTPRLYNPNAAANWSILLTPVFGSWCIYTNYKELGEQNRANTSLIVTVILAVIHLVGGILFDGIAYGALGILLLWYLIEARGQLRFLQERGIVYEKKPWGTPVLIGLAAVVAWVVLICVIE